MSEKNWWTPQPTDAAWCEQKRRDYPDTLRGRSDDYIREHLADGRRYAVLWDHTGDAYDQFEKVVDELSMWQRYAAYCNCCAKSGESSPMDFDAFVVRSVTGGQVNHD